MLKLRSEKRFFWSTVIIKYCLRAHNINRPILKENFPIDAKSYDYKVFLFAIHQKVTSFAKRGRLLKQSPRFFSLKKNWYSRLNCSYLQQWYSGNCWSRTLNGSSFFWRGVIFWLSPRAHKEQKLPFLFAALVLDRSS